MKQSMRTSEGKGSWDLVFWLALFIFSLWVWVPDLLPADAGDVRALSYVAAVNADAKQALVLALKESPNPSRGELRRMASQVNEILVTATAREVTGDHTLPTPAEVAAKQRKAATALAAELEAKAWSEMSDDERFAFLASRWQYGAFAALMIFVLYFGLRGMFFVGGGRY